jgi:NAD(P)-dependent dehydrogenase (short-subunit alcohol dehydrogenase family)
LQRPETIEETAEMIIDRGGAATAVQIDHTRSDQVETLMLQIEAEQGQLDLLVNAVWGHGTLMDSAPFWEQDLADGLKLLEDGLRAQLITCWHAVPLLQRRNLPTGLILALTEGITARYRGSLFHDLAKAGVNRSVYGMAEELRDHEIAVLALSPGYLRTEALLEEFGVGEDNWREALAIDPHLYMSESPAFVANAALALATDPDLLERSGQALASWNLAREYGFCDYDGSRPDWGTYAREMLGIEMG